MKKFGALFLVVLVAVMLSACTAFYDDELQTTAMSEPYQAVVFLQSKHGVNFQPSLLTEWEAEINRLITEMALEDSVAPKITAVKISDVASEDTYTVELTLTNVPPLNIQKKVRPFQIYYTQTIYNPIELLPNSEHFNYIVGYTTERRHSFVNTEWIEKQDDGSYVYLWSSREPIQFMDVYPNRPLYYFIIIAGSIVVGLIVYFVSRYSYCKKRQKQL